MWAQMWTEPGKGIQHPSCSVLHTSWSGSTNGLCRRGREVKLFDVATGGLIRALADDEGGVCAAGAERAQRLHRDVAAFSPSDELLLWGNALWDPRAPRRLHRFDQLTDFSGGVFHPAGAVHLLSQSQHLHGPLPWSIAVEHLTSGSGLPGMLCNANLTLTNVPLQT